MSLLLTNEVSLSFNTDDRGNVTLRHCDNTTGATKVSPISLDAAAYLLADLQAAIARARTEPVHTEPEPEPEPVHTVPDDAWWVHPALSTAILNPEPAPRPQKHGAKHGRSYGPSIRHRIP